MTDITSCPQQQHSSAFTGAANFFFEKPSGAPARLAPSSRLFWHES
jgi:hypothetical protein